MYKSPIEVCRTMDDMIHKIIEGTENEVYEAIFRVGVNVDKEELVKALQYDREQYTKGYNEGYNDGIKDFWERVKEHRYKHSDICGYQSIVIDVECGDIIAEEMVGDEK